MLKRLAVVLMFLFIIHRQAHAQASLAPVARQQFFDSSGRPLAGGKVFSYAAGTTTPIATYSDSTGVNANTNPITLDSGGFASIWITPGTAYKFVVKSSLLVTQYTADNITAPAVPVSSPFSTLQIFNAGISGTGSTGSLTAGSGITGTANLWTAQQTHTLNGVFTNTQMNPAILSQVGGINPGTDYQFVQGSNFATDAILGAVAPSSSGTAWQADGVAGYAEATGSTNAVGVYGQCIAEQSSSQPKCWGANFVVTDGTNSLSPASFLQGIEIDANPKSASTNGNLLTVVGAHTLTSNMNGIAVDAPIPVGTGTWKTGLIFQNGCCSTAAIAIAQTGTGNNVTSMPIQFSGRDSGGNLKAVNVLSDPSGDFRIQTNDGSLFSFNNGGSFVIPTSMTIVGAASGTCVKADGTGTAACVRTEYMNFINVFGGTSWAVPASLTEFAAGSTQRRQRDLTGFSQFRLNVSTNTNGDAGAKIGIQYSTNGGSTWSYLDASGSGSEVSVATAGSPLVGAWTTIATSAKADVQLRIIGEGGTATNAANFRVIDLELK